MAVHTFTGGSRNVAHRRAGRRAFTLLESMMALVIIGVGILAFVDAQSAFTQSNNWSSQAATGMLLANEIREMTRVMPRHDAVTGLTLTGSGAGAQLTGWGREAGEVVVRDLDDLDDFDGVSFGSGGTFPGPVDGYGGLIPDVDLSGNTRMLSGQPVPMPGWKQRVGVEKVDPYNFSLVRDRAYEQVATSQLPHIPVDRFPIRMTVIVEYTPGGSTQPLEITRLTWVVAP